MTRRRTPGLARMLIVAGGLGLLWQLVVWATGTPPLILPAPGQVAVAWLDHLGLILGHAAVTATEILLGLAIGALVGGASALVIAYFRPARIWLLPVLVASQAIPVFALAPVLVLWIGYGMASKVAMAVLIIYFPVTAAFLDGLRRTESGWLDLAHTMTAGGPGGPTAARLAILRRVRLPASLPALASGLRVATAVAPIGAVVGEWVGSSAGLGFLMLHANGRMQIDLMFAALLTLAIFSVLLWFSVDAILRRLLPWQPDTLSDEED